MTVATALNSLLFAKKERLRSFRSSFAIASSPAIRNQMASARNENRGRKKNSEPATKLYLGLLSLPGFDNSPKYAAVPEPAKTVRFLCLRRLKNDCASQINGRRIAISKRFNLTTMKFWRLNLPRKVLLQYFRDLFCSVFQKNGRKYF